MAKEQTPAVVETPFKNTNEANTSRMDAFTEEEFGPDESGEGSEAQREELFQEALGDAGEATAEGTGEAQPAEAGDEQPPEETLETPAEDDDKGAEEDINDDLLDDEDESAVDDGSDEDTSGRRTPEDILRYKNQKEVTRRQAAETRERQKDIALARLQGQLDVHGGTGGRQVDISPLDEFLANYKKEYGTEAPDDTPVPAKVMLAERQWGTRQVASREADQQFNRLQRVVSNGFRHMPNLPEGADFETVTGLAAPLMTGAAQESIKEDMAKVDTDREKAEIMYRFCRRKVLDAGGDDATHLRRAIKAARNKPKPKPGGKPGSTRRAGTQQRQGEAPAATGGRIRSHTQYLTDSVFAQG